MLRIIISCVILALTFSIEVKGAKVYLGYEIIPRHENGMVCVIDNDMFLLVGGGGHVYNISKLEFVGRSVCTAAKRFNPLNPISECDSVCGMSFYRLTPVISPSNLAEENVEVIPQDTITSYDRREVSISVPNFQDLDYVLRVVQYEHVARSFYDSSPKPTRVDLIPPALYFHQGAEPQTFEIDKDCNRLYLLMHPIRLDRRPYSRNCEYFTYVVELPPTGSRLTVSLANVTEEVLNYRFYCDEIVGIGEKEVVFDSDTYVRIREDERYTKYLDPDTWPSEFDSVSEKFKKQTDSHPDNGN